METLPDNEGIDKNISCRVAPDTDIARRAVTIVNDLFTRLVLALYYALFSRIPMQPFPGASLGYALRRWAAGRLLRKCGTGLIVKDRCYFGDGSRLSVGNNSQLGRNSRLNGDITIGDDCVMGPDVVIMSTSHAYDRTDVPIRLQGGWSKPIHIGDDVWVGTRAIILPGVQIGDHSIVAAGAVVTKSFPSLSIIGGVPARLLKTRTPWQSNCHEDRT